MNNVWLIDMFKVIMTIVSQEKMDDKLRKYPNNTAFTNTKGEKSFI